MLCLCGVAAGQEAEDGLERRVREFIRQEIQNGPLKGHSDFLAEFLKRYDETPKLECGIDRLIVYRDAVVTRATLVSALPFDARLSTDGRTLSLCRATLSDVGGTKWGLPPLEAHYHWSGIQKPRTLLIKNGESVRIIVADTLEDPRLVPVDLPAGTVAGKPVQLRYAIWSHGHAYTADLEQWKPFYWIGLGTTRVEWKDEPVPAGIKTAIIAPARPG
jgi:hypothetical protein